uniref:Alginate lyase 2 domain-containing protein n=1 Tax=Aegilops tauschii subsp. strangulata TaxID=200361 RepID=A0A453T529_AEGTS
WPSACRHRHGSVSWSCSRRCGTRAARPPALTRRPASLPSRSPRSSSSRSRTTCRRSSLRAPRRRPAAVLGLLRRQALPRREPTKPRSEILLNVGITYSSGVLQFEGYGYVPASTTGVSVMQVFGAAGPPRNTTLMLHVYGGRLVYYNDETKVVDGCIYDRWFGLNVVQDVQGSPSPCSLTATRGWSSQATAATSTTSSSRCTLRLPTEKCKRSTCKIWA